MGAIITLSLLGILLLYLGLYKAKNALLPVSILGLLVAFGFEAYYWNVQAEPLYRGMVIFDHFSLSFSMLCIALTILILLLSKEYFKSISDNIAEYYSLILFSLTGAILVCSYHNFAMLFIGLEIMSVALYILAGIRRTDKASNEASLKYFLMGAFSTGFLLFGITLLYGSTGSFDLAVIKQYIIDNPTDISPMFYGGILLLLVGLCFKVGAAPFHFWTPDVYDGAPILITIFMSTVVKIASFAGFLKLFSTVLVPLNEFWTPVLLTVVIITLFIGNVTALMQTSYKRMLAYSSISHAGYMLFAILSIGPNSTSGILTYSAAYGLASIISFGALILVKRQAGSDSFESFNGLGKRSPWLAFCITISMLSLAGIPLTAGFIGKFMMFSNVMNDYHTVLLVLAAINAAVGVYYYLRVVVHMYFMDSKEEVTVSMPINFQIVFVLSVILTFVLGVYPDALIWLAK
ncbi:NADH-quinone oxidoreductase subunit N [Sphingobacterium mizutaii NBRC 14946 = DSM 11724]|uniref:NADH-quinone oxidoreductase subunit N n=2 Tax=Sphingobacterium mizutaii TaxID=1010 RepID=A0AAJ4XFD8_9SPHI|nr:NADH-quinone oxidoreductase subunit N [Sphingobacterium mizutaii]GEM66453.1 NADH-quinone oxidoreductase subunit N [Sphingobacterium mizutaii NBRC 14946 = DSM 11724]SDL54147.1 NADH dehydrogenase subunit N [Sphingobacterium mizutaii]SNV63420.1 NADH-quinone oxidoreductase subunit N [Sphingobacterium mizutaii]